MRKRISTFIYVLKSSLTNPSYYKDVADSKFLFSLKYLYLLFYFTALVVGVVSAVQIAAILPQTPDFIKTAKMIMDDFYPEELVVTVEEGELSTNFETPYFIYLPSEIGDSSTRLITIDSKARFEDIDAYDTIILVSESAIYYPNNDNGAYEVFPLSDVDNFVINKGVYDSFVTSFSPYLDRLPSLLYVGIVLMILVLPFTLAALSLLGRLLYLTVITFALFAFSKVMRRDLTYKSIYKISMHAVSWSILYSIIVEYLLDYRFPYVYSLIVIGFAGFIIVSVFPKSKD